MLVLLAGILVIKQQRTAVNVSWGNWKWHDYIAEILR